MADTSPLGVVDDETDADTDGLPPPLAVADAHPLDNTDGVGERDPDEHAEAEALTDAATDALPSAVPLSEAHPLADAVGSGLALPCALTDTAPVALAPTLADATPDAESELVIDGDVVSLTVDVPEWLDDALKLELSVTDGVDTPLALTLALTDALGDIDERAVGDTEPDAATLAVA